MTPMMQEVAQETAYTTVERAIKNGWIRRNCEPGLVHWLHSQKTERPSQEEKDKNFRDLTSEDERMHEAIGFMASAVLSTLDHLDTIDVLSPASRPEVYREVKTLESLCEILGLSEEDVAGKLIVPVPRAPEA